MKLRTVIRDCLYLNWALPAEAMPPLPPVLEYQTQEWEGSEWAFASALLFRQQGLRLSALPLARLSHPQLNVRLYVLDSDGMPSVLFVRTVVPPWVVPAARWVGRQPAVPGRFTYPNAIADDEHGSRRWAVSCSESLEVEARPGAPRIGQGPPIGGWEAVVSFFRNRPRGYSCGSNGLRRVATQHPPVAVWPLAAEVHQAGLVGEALGLSGLPAPHSAFLCPEIPFEFELAGAPNLKRLSRAPKVATDPAMSSRAA